jgi:hypothetical protein
MTAVVIVSGTKDWILLDVEKSEVDDLLVTDENDTQQKKDDFPQIFMYAQTTNG